MLAGHQSWMPAATPAASDLRRARVPSQVSHPRSVSRAPAIEMSRLRTVLLLGTALLGVLAGTALLLSVVIEVPATVRADSFAENEAIARRFYATVNDAVRTGDLSLLDQVTVRNTDPMSATAGTRCDVRCRVSALHQLAPDVRLQVDDVLVDGDRVAARLTIQGNDRPELLGLPLQGDLAP